MRLRVARMRWERGFGVIELLARIGGSATRASTPPSGLHAGWPNCAS